MNKKSFFTIILLLLSFQLAQADPSVMTASSSLVHRGSVTITGTNFGTKVPAAPLWWDDMEGAADGSRSFTSGELSWVVSGVLSGNSKHYSEAVPSTGSEPSALMTYRNANYRAVTGPHSRSAKYAAGGHWQFANNVPEYSNSSYQNVALTIDSGTASKNVWYVHWYYRVDPNWTMLNGWENHKKSAPNLGMTIYDSPNAYMSSGSAESEGGAAGNTINYSMDNFIGACNRTETRTGPNAKNSWVAVEQLWDSPNGIHELWAWNGGSASGRKTYVNNPSGCTNTKNNTRSFSLGGWYCTNTNLVESNKRGHQNNFRYFDDIYVDNTFSRVVLANNATYENATIVEPQLPSAWNSTSITFTANLGKLPDNGRAYLFVFDSSNRRNQVGFCVPLGNGNCGDFVAPGAPLRAR